MSKKPLANITVKELCEQADINRGTFYRYYKDIYDLFNQLEKEMISAENINWVGEHFNYQEMCKQRFYAMLNLIFHNINFYKFFFGTELHSEHLETLIQNAHDNILKMLTEKNMIFDRTYFDYAFEYTRCGIIGLIKKWADHDCPEPPEVITDIIVHLLNKYPVVEN